LLAGTAVGLAPAAAAETVTIGTVGQASANLWPVFIGLEKGFFAAEDLKVDVIYVQSSAQLVQQITAGSLDICMSTGLVDPMRAIGMGAPIAIVRVEVQAPPYALLAKPSIKRLADLKGKVISLGGPKDITRIYVERMLAPHGVQPGEFDMVFAGATSARFAALQSGAVDAAILAPPFSFRAEAVRMMVDVSKMQVADVEKSYDFLTRGKFLEPTGKVSKAKLGALVRALQQLGDIPHGFDIERLILPGVTQLSD
jgi:ABC-type nitrate/sulfonate/bicarbonate transport system substrate-binding protein